MAGLIDDDYSAWNALGGAAKGFAQGLVAAEDRADRKEDRRMKQMEFEAKMRSEQSEREKKSQEEQYKKGKDNFDRAGKLRDDWLKNQTTKNSQSIKEAYNKIQSASPSAAGDMGLVFGYMKILDPGSTVREGEYANASNTTGAAGKFTQIYNKVMNGEILTPEQRSSFRREAGRLYQAQQKSQVQFDEEFGGLADTYKIPRGEVVLKIFEDPVTGEKKQVAVPAQQGLTAQPQGMLNKPKGLVPARAPKPKDELDNLSDEDLARLYEAKMKGK